MDIREAVLTVLCDETDIKDLKRVTDRIVEEIAPLIAARVAAAIEAVIVGMTE